MLCLISRVGLGRNQASKDSMAVRISNALGDSIDEPSAQQMRRFLEELDPTDDEHGAAWVSDEDGNVLEWNVDGRLVYDNYEKPPDPRHMVPVKLPPVMFMHRIGRIIGQIRLSHTRFAIPTVTLHGRPYITT